MQFASLSTPVHERRRANSGSPLGFYVVKNEYAFPIPPHEEKDT
jgi:hypothetical protein